MVLKVEVECCDPYPATVRCRISSSIPVIRLLLVGAEGKVMVGYLGLGLGI